jgi:hypothetical protein
MEVPDGFIGHLCQPVIHGSSGGHLNVVAVESAGATADQAGR